MIYKIIAKAIAKKLKNVLNFVIDEEQSGFVPNRFITDNAMITFEVFH